MPNSLQQDYILTYPGYWSPGATCQIRVYRPRGKAVVIVATELPDNDNTSITNRAEVVHYLAWIRAGKPEKVVFIEQYREEQYETVHVLRFPQHSDKTPILVNKFVCGVPSLSFGYPIWVHITPNELRTMLEDVPVEGGEQ